MAEPAEQVCGQDSQTRHRCALESIWVALWVSSALATMELSCMGHLEGPGSESGLG